MFWGHINEGPASAGAETASAEPAAT